MQGLAAIHRGRILPALVLAWGCGPGDGGLEVRVGLTLSPELTAVSVTVDPTFPEEIALVVADLAVGLVNAGPDTVSTVELVGLELRQQDAAVPVGGAFRYTEIDSGSAFQRVPVYDTTATNGELAVLCAGPNPVMRATVASPTHGSAVSDLPVIFACAPDRRAGELATRPLGANPAGKPCAIEGEATRLRLGWDAQGRQEIEDDDFYGGMNRALSERDANGRVVNVYRILEGIFLRKLTYGYEGGRLASLARDDFETVEEIPVTWVSDQQVLVGSDEFTLAPGGLSVTRRTDDAQTVTRFALPITLTAAITQGLLENAATYGGQSEITSTATGKVALQFGYTNDLITSQRYYVDDVDAGGAEWIYSCP